MSVFLLCADPVGVFLEEDVNLLEEVHNGGHDLVLAIGSTKVHHFTGDLFLSDFLNHILREVTLWVECLTHPVLSSLVTSDNIESRLTIADGTIVTEVAPGFVFLVIEESFLFNVALESVGDRYYFGRVVFFGDRLFDGGGDDQCIISADNHIDILTGFNT